MTNEEKIKLLKRLKRQWKSSGWETNGCVLCEYFQMNCLKCRGNILSLTDQERTPAFYYPCFGIQFNNIKRESLEVNTDKSKKIFSRSLIKEIDRIIKILESK